MRMLLKFAFDTEVASEAIRTGKMAEVNKALAESTRPEAAYYCTENGLRTGYIFFDLEDPSLIPVIAEPLFQGVKATVEPAMNDDDLQRGLAAVAATAGESR